MVLPNLSKTKVEVKQLVIKGFIVLILLIIVFMLMRMLGSIKNSIFPDPSLLPQTSFGKLPTLFPDNPENSKLTYSIDTITGLLPDFQKIVKVYKIIPAKPYLLALQKTQEKVVRVGFTKEGASISEESYQWIEQNPAKIITMNIFSNDFIFLTPNLTSQAIQKFDNSSQIQMAIDTAQSFLASMSLFPQDLDEKKTKTTNYTILNNSLSPASSISNTNLVKVDFFQKDIDNLPIYYQNNSNINLLIGKEQNQLRVMEAHFFYKNISDDSSSTYAIKTAAEAFIDLKQGKTYIEARPQENNILIKNVFLGYYMEEKKSDFLMPVIVFQGDNFMAYVAAIRDE